jgi:hypothetical protein
MADKKLISEEYKRKLQKLSGIIKESNDRIQFDGDNVKIRLNDVSTLTISKKSFEKKKSIAEKVLRYYNRGLLNMDNAQHYDSEIDFDKYGINDDEEGDDLNFEVGLEGEVGFYAVVEDVDVITIIDFFKYLNLPPEAREALRDLTDEMKEHYEEGLRDAADEEAYRNQVNQSWIYREGKNNK